MSSRQILKLMYILFMFLLMKIKYASLQNICDNLRSQMKFSAYNNQVSFGIIKTIREKNIFLPEITHMHHHL